MAWYGTIGNIINLRTVTIRYNESDRRAILNLGSDITYVLNHASKYIWPLQEAGRKVCLSLEGGDTGLGFCNLSDEQIADFVAQVKAVVEIYNLDGINLWDRNAGYGKDGMPETNTTSYPKLVKAMREALGSEKLLTLTVYEEPTATFWDTEATGGIEVGKYLDYAWSGYNKIRRQYSCSTRGILMNRMSRPILKNQLPDWMPQDLDVSISQYIQVLKIMMK